MRIGAGDVLTMAEGKLKQVLSEQPHPSSLIENWQLVVMDTPWLK